jgi:hypothetical protein
MHPDQMALGSSVRGGENDCFLWSGNLGSEVFLHLSEIRNFPEISMVIGHRSPWLLLVFYIPRCWKHFWNFPEISPLG